MRSDTKYANKCDDVDELREIIAFLNREIYECNHQLERVWAAALEFDYDDKYGYPTAGMTYGMIADDVIDFMFPGAA